MEVTVILTILVLNILLPTADVFTDINLAVKLWQCWECRYAPSQIYIHIYNETLMNMPGSSNPVGLTYEYEEFHAKMATVLMIPFILNYIVCFYTFFRLTTNRKKYLFIFPLLNLYPQYGKTNSI